MGNLRVVAHVAYLLYQRAKHTTVGSFLIREPRPEPSFEPQVPPLNNGDPVPGGDSWLPSVVSSRKAES